MFNQFTVAAYTIATGQYSTSINTALLVSYFNGQVSLSFLNVFFIVPSGFPQDVS